MKSRFLLLAIIGTAFVSCKKADVEEPNVVALKKLYSIGFTVWNFSDTTSVVGATSVSKSPSSSLQNQLDYLQYYVFTKEANGNYVLVKQKIQKSTDANFGIVSDSLPANHYYIYFVGCQAPGHMEMRTKANNINVPIFYYDNNAIYDTFYASSEVTLNGMVTEAVLLNRVVAKVQVKITDILPQEASAVRLIFADYPLGLDLTTGIGEIRAETETTNRVSKNFQVPIVNADKINTGFTFGAIVWAYDYPLITLSCIDVSGKTIAVKSIPKNRFGLYTRLEDNMQYNYTGSLFDTPGYTVFASNQQAVSLKNN
ncbi:hypothetical protein [Mucilaginibacter agri]|uniref:Fimbrillin-A associated anchor protein Mfa1 and Mfa2 n=1 Tax=Mucilaginibacter agri TaxID=2695265 RepID=A0A966DQ90_9SPHI|nr:hypothetical protein [Mucilaginibacter agri]NCD67808.1 hypothetical protein [Mucilaginibacter agri]